VTDVDVNADGLVDPVPVHPDPSGHATRGRSLRDAAMLTAAVGIAFSVIFSVSFVLMLDVPGPKATDQEIFDYYQPGEQLLPATVGLYIMPFAGIAFLWFIVALRVWASTSSQSINVLQSNIQLVSGVIFVALFFVGSAALSVLAVSVQYANGPVDPVTARQFPIFGSSILLFFAMRMAAMFVFTTSAIGRSTRILPRWFALIGFVVGLFLLLAASMTPVLMLVFPAWVIALCVILLRNAMRIPKDIRLPAGTGSVMNPLGLPKRPTEWR
jgi:hypothetical protein